MLKMLLAALLAGAPVKRPIQRPPHLTITCEMGGINYGLKAQACLPGVKFDVEPKGLDDNVKEEKDGTFTHRLQYQTTARIQVEMKVCEPYLVDYDVEHVGGHSLLVGQASAESGCITKQVVTEPGQTTLLIRTTKREIVFKITSTVITVMAPSTVIVAPSAPFIPPLPVFIIPIVPLSPALAPPGLVVPPT